MRALTLALVLLATLSLGCAETLVQFGPAKLKAGLNPVGNTHLTLEFNTCAMLGYIPWVNDKVGQLCPPPVYEGGAVN